MNRISTWRFPSNLKKCPLLKCKVEFKSRSLAIRHYKAHHASTSVLCFLCKKPISVKGNSGSANYRNHFKRMHPHVKLSPSQNTEVESNSKIVPPRSHFVKVKVKALSIAKQNVKKMCKICGIKIRNLSRHMMEIHTTKRILCPLRSCDFTSNRLERIRSHWKSVHRDLRFPEIARDSGFTYKTTTADTQECVNNLLILFSIFFSQSALKFRFFIKYFQFWYSCPHQMPHVIPKLNRRNKHHEALK